MIHFNFPKECKLDHHKGIMSIPGGFWLIGIVIPGSYTPVNMLCVNSEGNYKFGDDLTFYPEYIPTIKHNQLIPLEQNYTYLGISVIHNEIYHEGKQVKLGSYCYSNSTTKFDINPKKLFSVVFSGNNNYQKIVIESLVGKNPGVGFWHNDYGVKFINPDPSKNWIYSCLSTDGLTCLAVHDTGACILDVPF